MATKYVRSTGNNANDGSIGSPWLTIKYGLAHISGGDTLDFVQAHTFAEGDIFMSPAGSQVIPSGSSGAHTRIVGTGATITGDFYLRDISYIDFEGFILDATGKTNGIGLNGAADHITFTDIEIKNTNGTGFITGGAGGAISNITWLRGSIHDDLAAPAPGAPSHGMYWTTGGPYPYTISDVLIDGVDIYNIEADPNSFGITLYDSGTAALSNFTIRNSKIHTTSHGLQVGSGNGHLIHNNRIYDQTEGAGIEVGFGISSDCVIANNVIVNNPDEAIQIAAFGTVNNCAVTNNIIVGTSSYAIHVYGGSGHTATTNIFYSNGGTTTGTITTSGNLTSNPTFVDGTGPTYDFHLQAGSPGLDVGTNLNTLFTLDAEGIARGTNWDIGPYEAFTLPDADRYVATDGSDSNTGAIDDPYLTIQKGIENLSAGFTCYIREGTYDESLDTTGLLSGTDLDTGAITVQAYPGEIVTVQPSTGTGAAIVVADVAYWIFTGFYVDGSLLSASGNEGISAVGSSDHIRFNGMIILDTYAHALHMSNAGFNEVIHCTMRLAGDRRTPTEPQDGIKNASANTLIEHNVCTQNSGYGIISYTSGTPNLDNVIVRYNEIFANSTAGARVEILVTSGSDALVYSNLVYNDDYGIQMDFGGGMDGGKVYNNTIYNCAIGGIVIGSLFSTNSIKNNIIYLSSTPIIDDGPSTQSTNLTADPLFVDTGLSNFRLLPASPAIDAGIDLSAEIEALDFDNIPRTIWSIGAYEGTAAAVFVSSGAPVYGVLIQDLVGGGTVYRYTSGQTTNGDDFDDALQLLIPDRIERQVDPRESRFNTSSLTFTLIDTAAGDVTAVVSKFIGKEITFYMSSWGADWMDSEVLFVGIIQETALADRAYRITARSPIVLADKPIFSSARAKLNSGIDASVTTLTLDGNGDSFRANGYVLIGSERIAYSTKSGNVLSGLTRAALSSSAASHAAAAVVAELFVLGPAHPYDILASVLSDPEDSKTGLGMPQFVNTTNFATEKAAIGATYQYYFEINEAQNGKTWMEDEILKPRAYPYETPAGLISIKVFDAPSATTGTIGDVDCTDWAQWYGNYPKRVNRVVIYYDWDVVSKTFQSQYAYQDDGLIALYGLQPLEVESKGIHTGLVGTANLLEDTAVAVIARFGLQLPSIGATTAFAKRQINVADDIAVTFAQLLNPTLNTIGLNGAPTEILGVSIDFQRNNVDFDMFAHPPIFEALVPDGDNSLRADIVAFAYTNTPAVTVS